MKKRILAFLFAVVMLLQIFATFPAIAEGESAISISEMEVGVLYRARFKYPDVYLFDATNKPFVETPTGAGTTDLTDYNFPTELIVMIPYEGSRVCITNEDWPTEIEHYRYVGEDDLIILGKYEAPVEDNYIYGKVGIKCYEADGNGLVTLDKGGKVYALTELDEEISENARYMWQIKMTGGKWANVTDYVMPYAVLSEALLVNEPTSTGKATLRCIVTDGDKQYASDEIKLTKASGNQAQLFMNKATATYTADGTDVTPTAEEGTVDGAFQITISYVFAPKNDTDPLENAFSPYTASFYNVTDKFNSVVNSPFSIGFVACEMVDVKGDDTIEYMGKLYDPKPSCDFVDVGINDTDKHKVTIYYVPQKTNFIVEHYYQNLQDDGYSLAGMDVIKTKYTDEAVGDDLARNEYGYSALFYDKTITVSGNGNTVVEIYYDRVYYLVNFDLGEGGYGLMPYYVRFGTQVMLTEPTRPGYTFKNPWQLDRVYTKDEDTKVETDLTIDNDLSSAYKNKNANATITVKHNLHYTANWDAATASYTVIYWRENAESTSATDLRNYSVWATETKTGAKPGSTLDCSTIDIPQNLASAVIDGKSTNEKPYFTRANAMSDQSVEIKGDNSTIVNIYYTRNTYHILFSGITGAPNVSYRHTHNGTDCERELLCHTHDETCVYTLICTETEHTAHNADCLTCTKPVHEIHTDECLRCGKDLCVNHTRNCYTYTDINYNQTASWTYNGQEINGYIASGMVNNSWRNCIYIDGTWYRYNGNATTGTILSPTCHYQHTSECYNCGVELHSHSNSCYKDTIHTHTNGCYEYECSNVEANHTHTDACYAPCTKYTNNSNTSYSWTISAKYGADISDQWPTAELVETKINSNYILRYWSVDGISSNTATKRVTMTYDLCDTNDSVKTASATAASNKSQVRYIYYLFESFDQTSPENGYERQRYNGKYYDSDPRYYQITYGSTATLNSKPITGMKAVSDGSEDTGSYRLLFYDRNRNSIVFENLGTDIYTMSNVMFEQPLNAAFFNANIGYTKTAEWEFVDANGNKVKVLIPIPDTPSSYEEGSVYFAGWYTTPLCVAGTEFNFANNVMPDAEITLFAKWLPTEHNVKVYRQESEIGSTEAGKLLLDMTVNFGTQIQEKALAEYAKPNENYVFGGWYYKDGGEEYRYDFNTMLVKHSYVIYAKWIKNVPIPYTVKYVTVVDGKKVEIATSEAGIALEGVSKTFTAKTGADLLPRYNEWYFPNERYITFKMSANADDNVVEFQYETTESITYTIKHVFKNAKLKDYFSGNKTYSDNTLKASFDGVDTLTIEYPYTITKGIHAFEASITEKFNDLVTDTNIKAAAKKLSTTNEAKVWETIKGLTPDYFTQQICLTTDAEDNVITFTWQDAGTTTMYQVIHYMQNKDRNTYSVYLTEGYIVENVPGKTYSAEWLEEHYGFTRNEGKSKRSGNLPEKGSLNFLTLELYYDRAQYTYTVHHYVIGSTTKLREDEVFDGKNTNYPKAYYEQEISVASKAKDINGYVLYNGDTLHTIGTDNYEITVYYSPVQVTFRYQEAIAGRGELSNMGKDYIGYVGMTPADEATVTATARAGYRFVGWYLDQACTLPADSKAMLSNDGATITPKAPSADMANQTIVFYALFEPTTRVFSNDGVIDSNQAFIYNIQGNNGVNVTFVIVGNGSVSLSMLPSGTYTVTVLNWAWRYADPTIDFNGSEITGTNGVYQITIDGTADVVFDYSTDVEDQWLSDDAIAVTQQAD